MVSLPSQGLRSLDSTCGISPVVIVLADDDELVLEWNGSEYWNY